MRGRARATIGAVLAPLVLAAGCGPTVSLDEPRPISAEPETGSTTMHLPSLGSTTETGATSTGGAGASDDGDAPRLDLSGPRHDIPPSMDVPIYEPCASDEVCEPGLECVVLAYGELVPRSICTAPCVDPSLDCAPAPVGWEATCALHVEDGQLDVCAVACDGRLLCPAGWSCLEIFGPEGESQWVCAP